jgi:hypothetical protein
MSQKTSPGPKKRESSIQRIVAVGLFICFTGGGLSQAADFEPLPWGTNLEELNQAYKTKYTTGQIREDKERSEIEIQYSPARTIKIRRGELVALVSSTDSSSAYRLFGYAYEGKFFGQTIFFKDHPEFFPETINSTLKKKFPDGKIIRTLGSNRMNSAFEFKSDNLYVFTAEKGVFFYEPNTLGRIVKKFQSQIDQEKEKIEMKMGEKGLTP